MNVEAQVPLAALAAAKQERNTIDFFGNDQPKCPHCGLTYDISQNGAWNLYEEGEHEATCDKCELDFVVSVRISYTFSTENQD